MFRNLGVYRMSRIAGMVMLLVVAGSSVKTFAADPAVTSKGTRDLALEAALKLACQNSSKLKVAAQKVAISGENVTQAEAAYRPRWITKYPLLIRRVNRKRFTAGRSPPHSRYIRSGDCQTR
jgi:hypothetical protein